MSTGYVGPGRQWVSVADTPQGGSGKPMILANVGQPTFLLSSATNITSAGLITGLTALGYTPVGVVLVFVALGGSGGVTGLYYARFSSTTSCQLYTDAAGTVAPSGITSGAYAGTTALCTLSTVTVPGGSMGPNGAMDCVADCSYNSGGSNKTFYQTFAGSTMSGVASSAGVGIRLYGRISNKGTTQQQEALDNSLAAHGAAGGVNVYTFNTDVDVAFNIKVQLAAATDWACVESFTARVYFAA